MAHNRSVLKERRIHPGALTCFAVAECLVVVDFSALAEVIA
jgi:hypothetical protein